CRATNRHYEPPDFAQTPAHPVVKVNWFDAMAFCKWLTEKERDENLIEDRQSYRLPTDKEWSSAVGLQNESGATPQARDGKIKNEFPWGKQWPPPASAGNYGIPQKRGATMPVGSFKANSLVLYDLGGNVWEWCLCGIHFASRDFLREKFRAIDFWEFLERSGTGRPFHLERVRLQLELLRQVALDRPGMNGFAAFLFD